MDIASVTAFIQLAREALATFRQAKNLLPDGPQKDALSGTVEQAEQQLGIAEVKAAADLGFDLCHCDFPPVIMLWDKQKRCTRCPKCGDERPAARVTDPFSNPTPSRWRL